MNGKRLIIGFLLILSVPRMLAQSEPYNFNRLDITHGLSHNRVNCIFKDSQGFMWFGTLSGLNRYDGYTVKVFRQDLHDSSSISDNDIISIAEDTKGRLWIVCGQRFNVYDPTTESFHRDPGPFLREYSVPGSSILGIHKDRTGNLWFIFNQAGLYRYEARTKKGTLYTHNASDTASLSSNDISAVAQDMNGSMWIVSQQGVLEKMDISTGRITDRFYLPKVKNNNARQFYNIYIDLDGDIWVYFTIDPLGIYYVNPVKRHIRYLHRDRSKQSLNNDIVNGVVQDDSRRIWIATDHGGINLLDKKDFSIQFLMNNPNDEKSLSQNSINTIFRDQTGIIWMGTFKKGICYYNDNILKFRTYKNQSGNSNSLSFDDVNCFAEDKRGNLWIGTNGGGLIYFDRPSNRFFTYMNDPANPASISSNIIVSLCIDRDQKLWIGTYFGGLNCFNGKRFIRYKHNPQDPKSLADDRVWAIFEDSQANLWVGTLGGGLDLFDRENDVFYHYRTGGVNSVHSDFISSLTEDIGGNLWIGTASGVDVLEKQTGQFIHYGHDGSDPRSLSNDNIYSILQDSRGNIWIGTRVGLNLLDRTTKKFRIFRTDNGLPDNTVFTVLEDNQQNLWVSTANGLSNIIYENVPYSAENSSDAYTFSFRNYDESDGLQGREFNDKAGFRNSRGELIFGGANGFNIILPENITLNKQTPKIVFTDFQIFNQSVIVSKEDRGRVILSRALNETQHITLKYKENVFSIEFAALSYFHPEKNKYKYILEGFNKDWLTTDAKLRKATYTNLDPGEYTFRVKASNNDGYWNEDGISIGITILPPLWKTKFALVLYFFLALGFIYLARKMVLDRARIRFKLEQELREAQRIRELDLMKTKFFTNVSHEFRTPLALITAPLDKIIKTTKDQEQKRQFTLIQLNAKRLLNLVNQLLDFRRLEVQEFKFSPSYGDIVRFIGDIAYSFSDMAEKKHIRFSFHAAMEKLNALFDNDKLEKIIFNLLSNAFKFTRENGYVEVAMDIHEQKAGNFIRIKVMDNGIGIPPDKQEKIFERYFQVDGQGAIINQGSGIGLSLTREFVKIHGGTIAVESEPEKGSCFTVLLPLIEYQGKLAEPELPEKEQELSPQNYAQLDAEYDKDHLLGTHKPLLLLIEDNEDFRFYLKDNLIQRYSIIESANGKEGWDQTLRYFPNLIVADITMPEMDGIALCRTIKQDRRTSHIPIILLTSRASEEQRVEGFQAGADDYITKPFSFEILELRIKNLIAEREMLKKLFQKQIEINPGEISITSMDEKLIRKALETVEKNISNPDFSVEELSRELGMSRVHLYKKLLSLTGKSPIEFIRSVRLKRAAQLFMKSQLRVSEIAFQVGFNNPKYFSKYFKQEFGQLPSEYAENQRVEHS
jgi:signal transduction histidine kinase/ligand-binding sensor domain-containing protein/DNA-binding response OmpR family regulator